MFKTDKERNICVGNKIILCYGPKDKHNPKAKGWHFLSGGFTTDLDSAVRYAGKVCDARKIKSGG